MKQPIQITFRNLSDSAAIKQLILNEAEQLEHFSNKIINCRVVVEAPHKSHQKGNLYHVNISLTVPGTTLVVTRGPSAHHANQDLYLAVREAFDEMRRQLQDFTRIRRTPYRIAHGPNL